MVGAQTSLEKTERQAGTNLMVITFCHNFDTFDFGDPMILMMLMILVILMILGMRIMMMAMLIVQTSRNQVDSQLT